MSLPCQRRSPENLRSSKMAPPRAPSKKRLRAVGDLATPGVAASLLRQQPSLQLSSKHASVGDLPHLQGEGIPERPLLGGIETGLVDGCFGC